MTRPPASPGVSGAVVLACLLPTLAPRDALSYTDVLHERSVRDAAGRCEADLGTSIPASDLAGMVKGAREPDAPSLALLEIGVQRFEPGARGTQRDINPIRISEQSFHGSPNPTRPPYGDRPEEQQRRGKALSTPEARLLPDRFDLDVYSYDTNRMVRNKLLLNASQLLCVSFAHADDGESARKLGNLLHMVGDTYSASHVQRSAPVGSPPRCGTEKIEWHFSMDLILWKAHGPADREDGDWRFRCLVEHAAQLMRGWVPARAAARSAPDAPTRLSEANAGVARALDYLCHGVFREDPEVLELPSGGAAAGYSIASGTDNYERVFLFWRRRPPDRPIQPAGLTGAQEAAEFVARVNAGLESRGRPPYFVYPSRDAGDYCEQLDRHGELPAPLRCTPQEIEWAMEGSDEVEELLIPPRSPAPGSAQ